MVDLPKRGMDKMLKKIALALFLLCFLGGQALANPLLGRWDVVSIKASDLMNQLSIDRYKVLQPKVINFMDKELGVIAHDNKENRVPVQYKEINDKLWGFSVDEGKTWYEVTVQDEDTLIEKEKRELDVEIIYTLKRKK